MEFDEEMLATRAKDLDQESCVAFCLSCIARMLPNYSKFMATHGWGDLSVLKQAVEYCWRWTATGMNAEPATVEAMIQAVERAEPETEDFDSIFVSPALDAAVATGACLRLVSNGPRSNLIEVASLARDSVDMYVQEILSLDPTDENLEDRILEHPLMQRELVSQAECLAELEAKGVSEWTSLFWLKWIDDPTRKEFSEIDPGDQH